MDHPLTLQDLEDRWRPPGKTIVARRRWLRTQLQRLHLHSFIPGRPRDLRFRVADVLRAEARGADPTPASVQGIPRKP